MLSTRSKTGNRLPWLELVHEDLADIFKFHKGKLDELGDPSDRHDDVCLERCVMFIKQFPAEWQAYVSTFHTRSMRMDIALEPKSDQQQRCRNDMQGLHICDVCEAEGKHAAFANARALYCHMRQKHRLRNPLKRYVDGSLRCPVCAVQFESRIRVIAHVSEKRMRGKSQVSCRLMLEQGTFPTVPAALLTQLDEQDRLSRRVARRNGKSQPKVHVPAKRSRIRGCQDSDSGDLEHSLPKAAKLKLK